MLGVINLDKPVGPTSHDMVALVRRLAGVRRIGHAGTLDPLASGVLPILVGQATRLSEELTTGTKRYDARIRLGWRSATDDAEGPLERGGSTPAATAVAEAIAAFRGRLLQRPPRFSARKVGGEAAYRASRAGRAVDLPPREVQVESLEIVAIERAADHLDLQIDLRCSAGTYVRAIARDLGDALACGGYLAALRRTQAAGLPVEESISPERLEAMARAGKLEDALLDVSGLITLPRIALDSAQADRFRHGAALHLRTTPPSGRLAVFEGAVLLGVGTASADHLQPDKVLDSTVSP